MVVEAIVEIMVMGVVPISLPPILIRFLCHRNSGHPFQILVSLPFHSIITNIKQMQPNKIMLATFLKPYGINCPHILKGLFLIHNVIINSKATVLLPNLMIILFTLLLIPYLCMPLILYITCVQKQPTF